MAERQGFEPWVPAKAQRFSRPPRSTTPASLRMLKNLSFSGLEGGKILVNPLISPLMLRGSRFYSLRQAIVHLFSTEDFTEDSTENFTGGSIGCLRPPVRMKAGWRISLFFL